MLVLLREILGTCCFKLAGVEVSQVRSRRLAKYPNQPTSLRPAVKLRMPFDQATGHGAGAHKARAAAHRELARWATTLQAFDSFDRLSKLKRLPWKRWDEQLWWSSLLVAAGVRLMATKGLTKARAITVTGGSAADLNEAILLLNKAGLSVHDVIAEQSDDVEMILAANLQRLHVRLEQRALEDMLLAAAEGYKVPPGRGFRYTEVYGLCFGSVRRQVAQRQSQDLFANIGRVATQMRAKATASEVMPNVRSRAAQLEVGNQFFPHLEVLGEYHTHPERSFSIVADKRGWEPSPTDEAAVSGFVEEVCKQQHNPPLFSFVVAVAERRKSGKHTIRKQQNVIQLAMGSLVFVIAVYRILLDGSYEDEVDLSLPALVE